MKPWVEIMVGDVREQLAELPDGCVHCVVTSPPYWGLRDYGAEPQLWGGDSACAHEWGDPMPPKPGRGNKPGDYSTSSLTNPKRQDEMERGKTAGCFCIRCNAWVGDLGLEPTVELYIEHMVEVFREVKRVLRDDGTLWLNMGDCYSSGDRATWRSGTSDNKGHIVQNDVPRPRTPDGLKAKDLVGQPWRLAFALQADGWYLRSDIIWHKPNPMPESCRDRPTKAHEYVFLLTKKPRYFFDQEAVREGLADCNAQRTTEYKTGDRGPRDGNNSGLDNLAARMRTGSVSGRNIRTVWRIPTQSFAEAHFATFPEKLVQPCIKAGTSEKGCCPECGAPWVRVVKRTTMEVAPGPKGRVTRTQCSGTVTKEATRKTTGWQPGCDCIYNALPADVKESTLEFATGWIMGEWLEKKHWPIPCTVLDPFGGSGTTGLVALKLGRRAILVELNPEYAEMARKRTDIDVQTGLLQV